MYLLSTRVGFSFAVKKLAKFPSNPGKVHFGGLVHMLRYIKDNKTLGMKYNANMIDASITELLRQDIIRTKNQLMDLSDPS